MRNKLIASVVIVALLAGGGWWWRSRRSTAASAKNKPQYVFATVRKGDIRSTISGTGPVASTNGIVVKSTQAATVKEVLAQDGDRVQAGQVVVVLESDSLQSSLKQAQMDVLNNQASLDNLLNPQATAVRAQMLKVESARLTLQQRQKDVAGLTVKAGSGGVIASVKVTKGSDVGANTLLFTIFDDQAATLSVSLPQESASALKPGQTAEVELAGFGAVEAKVLPSAGAATPASNGRDANVPVNLALPPLPGLRAGMVARVSIIAEGLNYQILANGSVVNDAAEVRTLVAGNVGDVLVAEGDRVAAGDTLLQLTSDSLQLGLQQAENDLKTQEQNLENLLDPANDPSGQLRSLTNKLEQSRLTLATRQLDVEDLQVKAPVAGQISALAVKMGDRVTNNLNLFRVADYGHMQMTISVDELDIAKTKLGQRATITLDALPGKTYQGKVTKINPEGVFRNDIATFDVTITVEKPEGLMAGMNSNVTIVVEEVTDVLWLPAGVVRVQQGRAMVQVLENGQAVQKEVQVGLRTSTQVEIKGGLQEGDQVIQTIIQPAATGFGMFGGNRQQTQTTFPTQQTDQRAQQVQQRNQQRTQPTTPAQGR